MGDLLSAYNGAIPVRALRAKVIHNRVNKLVVSKKKKEVVVEGGGDLVLEKVVDLPPVPARRKEFRPVGHGPTKTVVRADPVVEVPDEEVAPVKEVKVPVDEVKVLDRDPLEVVKIETTQEVSSDKTEEPLEEEKAAKKPAPRKQYKKRTPAKRKSGK